MSLLLPFTLAAIMTTDPLGYECVPEEQLEVAFSLGGKGMRIPQTCIIDPCKETFSEVTLANFSGYQDDMLYRDYRQRVSSVCGAPTLWDDRGLSREELLWAAFDGGSGPVPRPGRSFQPVSDAAEADPTPRARAKRPEIKPVTPTGLFGTTGGGTRSRSSFPAPGPGVQPISVTQTIVQTFDQFEPSGPVIPTPVPPAPPVLPPAPVPLPAPFFLLAAAGISMGWVKWRRRGAGTAADGRA